MSDFFQNLMIYCLLSKTTQAEKVGVLGKSFGKITLLKKNLLTNTFIEIFVSNLRAAVVTPGVPAWETK